MSVEMRSTQCMDKIYIDFQTKSRPPIQANLWTWDSWQKVFNAFYRENFAIADTSHVPHKYTNQNALHCIRRRVYTEETKAARFC